MTYKSVSKSFNLGDEVWLPVLDQPGLPGPDTWRRQHRQALNTLAVIAAQAAYTDCDDWLDQLVAYIDGTHDLVESFVAANIPQVRVVKPEGTYLSWLDVSGALDRVGIEDEAAASEQLTPEARLQRHLVEPANIHINPGTSYGSGGVRHMRMNIATSRQLVELALRNMAAALV